jgi:hypothetical protein
MEETKKVMRDVLPYEGVWTVQDLANYLGMPAKKVMQSLSDMGVPIVSFSRMYRNKLFRLEDLRKPSLEEVSP